MCLQSVDEEKYKRLGMKSVFLKHKLMELEKKIWLISRFNNLYPSSLLYLLMSLLLKHLL